MNERERREWGRGVIIFLSFHSVCPAGKDYVADRLSGTCYRLELQVKKWPIARADCAANGEMLVVLEPVVKAQFMKDFLIANTRRFCDGEKTATTIQKENPFCTIHSIICIY